MSISSNPLVWPPLSEELAPFLRYCQGIVLNAGAGQREAKLGQRDLNIDIGAHNRPHVMGDLHCIPLLDESVDTIISIAVLEHTRFPWIVTREFLRVLRPGGCGVIAVPFLQPQHASPHDFVRFTEAGLIELMRYTGFEVLETTHVHHFGQTLAWLLWEYLQHNRPSMMTEPLWAILLRRLSRGKIFKGDSPNTHNTHYVVVRKPGERDSAAPHYREALARTDPASWFLPLLACPRTRQPLHWNRGSLVSEDGAFIYAVEDGVPNLVVDLDRRAPAPSVPSADPLTVEPPSPAWPPSPTVSEQAFSVSFKPELRRRLSQVRPAKVALLVSSEYEGIHRNGGIGTYYKSLCEQLAADNWYVVLLLTYSDRAFGGKSSFAPVKHIFSTKETEEVLSLRAAHRRLLTDRAPSVYDHHSFSCQLFTQAVLECFRDARVYVEFPEMLGAAHHLIHAKHAGLLEDRCVIAVTMHSGHEWVFEANEKYVPDKPDGLWQVASYEAFSFEQADLAFFPSHFLRAKVESYGWRVSHATHMPYFVPLVDRSRSRRSHLPKIDQATRPVVFFGRLEERKGLCTFVEALKSLPRSLKPRLHILFVGKVVPLFSEELRHLHSAQYLERELSDELPYHILSDLHSADALQYLGALRDPVVCLTSPEENFPHSALELGQLPLKLVVSDTGGFRETLALVQRSADVYWFEPKSVASLADAISAAVHHEPPSSPVSDEARIRETNLDLRARRLARIAEAFGRVRTPPAELPSVSVGLVWRDGGGHLIECLHSLATQTHPPVDVIVLDETCADTRVESAIDQAQQLFPQFRFMKGSATQSPGAARNHLVASAAKSAYHMTLDADSILTPFAIERLVTAASRSGAAIISFPRNPVGGNRDVGAGVASSVPGLLAAVPDGDTCHLVSMSLLREYRYLEDLDALTHGWEVVAAALATGALLVHYPYPLCEPMDVSSVRDATAQFKQRYKLRQYLTQIPAGRWSQRQLHMLLAATQHLQFSGDAHSLPNVPVQRVASEIQAREIARYISVRKLVKAMAIKVARRPGFGWTYRFRDLAKRVLGG